MPPIMAGIMRFINHNVIVVAIMAIGLGAKLVKNSAATLPRNPKSMSAILIGLMVCTKKMAVTKIMAVANGISNPKNDKSNTNCKQ